MIPCGPDLQHERCAEGLAWWLAHKPSRAGSVHQPRLWNGAKPRHSESWDRIRDDHATGRPSRLREGLVC